MITCKPKNAKKTFASAAYAYRREVDCSIKICNVLLCASVCLFVPVCRTDLELKNKITSVGQKQKNVTQGRS